MKNRCRTIIKKKKTKNYHLFIFKLKIYYFKKYNLQVVITGLEPVTSVSFTTAQPVL